MSGPYRFHQEQSRSPLDRQPPNLFPAGQPPSFKTNVNRAKTKKWVEAKPYSYDGDDWGDVDEYDEYGAEQPPPPPDPQAPASFRPPAQRAGDASRSFTDPQRQAPPQLGRRNSFETGDEHRAFSASIPPPQGQPEYGAPQPQPPYGKQVPPYAGTARQPSAAESDTSDTPQHRRDFSPSALPPPLTTRMSPGPASATSSPATAGFPPRKSSIGQADSPVSLRERAPSNPTKPLPFIRPADIYRRVEEERQRERASLDSSRPSLDSLSSRPREDPPSSQDGEGSSKPGDANRSLHPLEPVAERKSEYMPEFNPTNQEPLRAHTSVQSSLPQIEPLFAFNDDLWSSGAPLRPPTQTTSENDSGLRSVVDQAFTRTDDQRSMPPTPISKDSDSSVSRSNTNSTSGISPIMSRVPSSATSALKYRENNGAASNTPAIAEEPGESSTPVSRPVSTAMLGGGSFTVPRKPSPSHSRNVSSSSLSRAGLSTPSPGESPARSPAIEPQRDIPEPEHAQVATLRSPELDNMDGGLTGPSPSYATREADIASAMRSSPEQSVPVLSAAEKDSQNAFLDSHQNAQSPIAPRSRSESPSKGRVQELAGKFGDISHSRRGSTQSNASKHSVESWERSGDNSRPTSPIKSVTAQSTSPTKQQVGERPLAGREVSFRPKLPGQWESYATSVPTPLENDADGPLAGQTTAAPGNERTQSPLDEVDLTPTTAKHSVSATGSSESPSDTLAALKAAGTAMGEALQASVGLGSSQPKDSDQDKEKDQDRAVGNLSIARPIQLDRTASSVASSIPPTPPEKDTPGSEFPPPPPLKDKGPEPPSLGSQQQTPTRPTILPQLSTAPSSHDQESDRLRKEIVASLSPQRSVEDLEVTPHRASLLPSAPGTTKRESSILPSEYDSYWADGDHTSPRPSHDLSAPGSRHSPVTAKSAAPRAPELLTRFSWEDGTSGSIPPEQQAQAGAATPSNNISKDRTVASPIDSLPSQSRSFEGIPDPYFGPAHTAAIAKPPSIKDSNFTARSPTSPTGNARRTSELTEAETVREAPPTAGLHVVNSDTNPEAVDIPARLSKEVSPVSQPDLAQQDQVGLAQQPQEAEAKPELSTVPDPIPEASALQESTAKSPTSDKPLGFRDILNIKSPSERISTYNRTRDYWANADHGLSDWMSSAMAANPELASNPTAQHRPQVSSTSSRHRPTASLSLFGKSHASSNAPPTTPYYEQYNSAASQVPTTPTTSTAPGAQASASSGGRSTSHQMQNKGKDLLHTAGMLGGKGMTGAKGLFAKGKSRFKGSGGDKVDK